MIYRGTRPTHARTAGGNNGLRTLLLDILVDEQGQALADELGAAWEAANPFNTRGLVDERANLLTDETGLALIAV